MGRILLHSCCAPCSGAIIEKLLSDGEDFSVFFSNSNIDTPEEYRLRFSELKRYCDSLGVEVVEDEYNHSEWLKTVEGLENERERGARCSLCFRYRLKRAAQFALENGFELLTTSLASSRWKDLDQVNTEGERVCGEIEALAKEKELGEGKENIGLEKTPEFWSMNWRKNGLQQRRSEIIKEQNFYNQDYCGCEFSHR